jgi:hypothetical protein
VAPHICPTSYFSLVKLCSLSFPSIGSLRVVESERIIVLLEKGNQDLMISFLPELSSWQKNVPCCASKRPLAWNWHHGTGAWLRPSSSCPRTLSLRPTVLSTKHSLGSRAHLFAKSTVLDRCQAGKKDFHRRPLLRFGLADAISRLLTSHESVEGINPLQ